jgi:hypothetical protein
MMGDEFDIMDDYQNIEFASGVLLSKDGKEVIISAGISDCYGVMVKIPLLHILRSMRNVGL